VEIIDKSEEKVDVHEISKIVDLFAKSKLKLGTNTQKQLGIFKKKAAKINSSKNGAKMPIKFLSNNEIVPTVFLEDEGIVIDPDTDELNFDQLDNYCLSLLDRILEDHLPGNQNGIQEL